MLLCREQIRQSHNTDMQSFATLARLYTACGYRVKPLMAHRLLGLNAAELFQTMEAGASLAANLPLAHDELAFERKMWRVRRVARLIACLPFVRGIAICNSLGFHMVHQDSDVDLFIITRANRVWSARWWVAGVLALMRMRHGEARRDPVCVSFFVDERVNDVSDLMIERDVYFHYWLRTLMPVWGEHALFALGAHTAPEFRVTARWPRMVQRVLEIFARALSEAFVHRQQQQIMPEELRTRAELHDTTVVLSETIVKLHQNDRRIELRDQVMV